jgi:hypothetical protein
VWLRTRPTLLNPLLLEGFLCLDSAVEELTQKLCRPPAGFFQMYYDHRVCSIDNIINHIGEG